MAYVYLVASGFENISPALNCLKRKEFLLVKYWIFVLFVGIHYKPISSCIPYKAKNPTDMFLLDHMLIDINSTIAFGDMCCGI